MIICIARNVDDHLLSFVVTTLQQVSVTQIADPDPLAALLDR